ncbi:hypothetical protein SCUP234_08702 [Seiridium cupressi]
MLILKSLALTALAALPIPVRSQDGIPITGLNSAIADDGQRPARLNINYLQALGGPQWDLYILGLRAMQQLDQNDPESFFQIAGIHGRPYIPWNGVGKGPGTGNTGYCFHNEIPFITWHRPYLALYEQILGRKVQDIANEYTGDDAAQYMTAAESFRIPFWDWADDSNLPPSTTWPEINVNTPKGKETVPNPLYSFKWPEFPLNNDPDWFPTTTDGPVYWNSTGSQRLIHGDNSQGNLGLNTGNLQDKVYSVLSKVTDFDVMSTTKEQGPSIEDPHGDIHLGSGIFMQNVIYSSFDPVFWLHHSNVDRLFALWQAINYNATYQSKATNITGGTFTQAPGTWMTADDPLMPFYQDDGKSFHTGRSIAAIKTFGYTYPEINDWSISPDRTRQLVIRQVNQLYGPNKLALRRKRRSRHHRPRSSSDDPSLEKQYYVQIGVERSELDLPCTIQVKLGDDLVAGSMAVMAMPSTGRTNSEIQLNRAIEQLTSSVGDKTVVPLLEQKLRVEVRKSDGTVIPIELVPSLTVDVESVDVQLSESDDQFPNYGTLTNYPTIGRPSNGYASSTQQDGTVSEASSYKRATEFIRACLGW